MSDKCQLKRGETPKRNPKRIARSGTPFPTSSRPEPEIVDTPGHSPAGSQGEDRSAAPDADPPTAPETVPEDSTDFVPARPPFPFPPTIFFRSDMKTPHYIDERVHQFHTPRPLEVFFPLSKRIL